MLPLREATLVKNIAEKVFTQLPGYVGRFAQLVSRPKTMIGAWNSGKDDDFEKALVFVGVSVGIGFILQAPAVVSQQDFATLAAAMIAFKVVAIFLFAFVIWAAFRIVGGRGEFMRTLIAYIYMVSPLYVVAILLTLISLGFVRGYDPDLAPRLRIDPNFFANNPEALADFTTNHTWLALGFMVTNLLSSLVFFGWFIICLGAYRALHGVTRLRSGVAAALIVAAFWPFTYLLGFLSFGMFGSLAPPLH
jgi:hypothetical protein